ncbi:MAG: D-alanyl-D-alanine carboxypeptidase family protein [Bacilli bacterium]|nr:D-alanyl-D-alanine carboxypeptidase family protein [Bacilli bacterium]
MQILFCDTLLSVRLIYYLKVAINLLRFIVPILLIIKVTLDVYKGILNANDDKGVILKKSSSRIIAAIIIFLVPTLIGVLFSFMGTFSNEDDNYQNNFLSCYNKVDSTLIEALVNDEDARLTSEENERLKQSLVNYANYEAYQKSIQENANKVNETSTGSTYSSNLTDTNKQNGVYVQNGVFYKPKYVSGNPSTYSGKNCPSNPLSQGYNNKYGYNNYFYNMLQQLIEGAKKAGYNLSISSQGCRSYATQESYYKSMEKGRAASPGRSNHGWGIASDVTFYKNASSKCGSSRTRTNCPGMAWVHDHAKDYGLHFPLLNASYKEDWHIEPINLKTY